MTHDPNWNDAAELVALFAIGAATPAEQQRMAEHLAAGCADCDAELQRLQHVLVELMVGAPAVTPPPRVKQALLARIAGSASSGAHASPLERHLRPGQGSSAAGLVTIRGADAQWEQTQVPGVQIRVLSIDPPRDQFTALVRMAPGSSYPRHVHRGPEHCLVLEGDLRVGEETLHAGDYQLATPDSGHGVQSTEQGCLLFIQSSLSDEFV